VFSLLAAVTALSRFNVGFGSHHRLDVDYQFGLLSAQQLGWVVRSSLIVDPLHICSD